MHSQQSWKAVLGALGAALLATQSVAVEPGQGSLRDEKFRVVRDYQQDVVGVGLGAEAALCYGVVTWDIGDSHCQGTAWWPSLALTYSLNRIVDLRATTQFASLTDDSEGLDGETLDFVRTGIGSRAWIPTPWDVLPFVGLGLNSYWFDASSGDNEEAMFGVSAEAGVAYVLNDWTALQVVLQVERNLNTGSVVRGTEQEEVGILSVGAGLGLRVRF